MSEFKLFAGAGRAEIRFPADMFPTDKLYGVHDAPCARVLLFECGVRAAIVSLELVNAPEDSVESVRKNVEAITGTPFANIWVHVTHAITTPHAPGGPFGGPGGRKPGAPKPPMGGGFKPDPDAPRKRKIFIAAIDEAAKQAAEQAIACFREARLCVGEGQSLVNVNRDVETPFGWWIAQNPEGPSNKTMTVVRFDGVDGKPIGALVSYGLKPSAIDMAGQGSEDRKVSADVPGCACRMAEETLGAPVLFCMSAAGDQVPREQAFYERVTETGEVERVDLGMEKGYEIVERLGREMGGDILRTADAAAEADVSAPVLHETGRILCGLKERAPGFMSPKKELDFKQDGEDFVDAEILTLGDIAFVAIKPETNTQTELELKTASPFKHTLLISMVNGGMKYMPDRSAYDRVTWEAQSAMVMPGTAEKWVERVTDMLKDAKEGKNAPVITVVGEPFSDGQRITRAILEFNGELPDVEGISVVDRTVTARKVEGHTVTLELSLDDKKAKIIPDFEFKPGGPFGPGGPGPGGPGGPPPFGGPGKPGGPGPGPGGPGRGPGRGPTRMGKKRRPIAVEVMIPGYDAPIVSTRAIQPVIDDFVQGEYKGILYNLFVPKDYDPAKEYPLVLFIPDASPNGDDPLLALAQGIGGTIWADPAEQAKHPCFVLAIQVPSGVHLTDDDYTVSDEFDIIMELFHKIVSEYSIDKKRLYNTGQSQGCMASCEMDIRWPDLFAASMLIAGHWDPEKMMKLTRKPLLFGLSEGGLKEYPNFNAITDGLEAQGVKVARIRLNFRDGFQVNDAKVREGIGDAQDVYIIFDEATAFPDDGKERVKILHHQRGWELCYCLESARDWLFSQHL